MSSWNRAVFFLAPAVLLGAGCGFYSNADDPEPDLPDAAEAVVPDEAREETEDTTSEFETETDREKGFCEGTARALVNGALFDPVSVTSERLIMDCCDGFILRFHLSELDGPHLAVMFRFEGDSLRAGEYVLDGSKPLGNASVFSSDGQFGERQNLLGTLQISGEGDSGNRPFWVTLCGRVEEPGRYAGTRLWVGGFPLAPYSWENRLGIYLLKDPNISATAALDIPLDSLELASAPWAGLLSIAYYRWGTHTLFWDSWHRSSYLLSLLPRVGVHGLPFVVVADGERIYLGAFMSLVSSVGVDAPVVMIDGPEQTDDHLMIENSYPGAPAPSPADPRADPRIRTVLTEAGKLAP